MAAIQLETNFLDLSQSIVRRAESIEDLLPFLRYIPLLSIQSLINQHLNQQSPSKVKSIYHKAASIDEILPCDVMQHVLSFDSFYHPRTVSKAWKSLSDKNEANYLKKMYAPVIVDEKDDDAIEYDKTFICHPKRTRAHPYEIGLGYEGPMSLSKAIERVNCADGFGQNYQILVHNGVYNQENGGSFDMDEIENPFGNLSIVGLGKGAVLKSNIDLSCSETLVRLKNLEFAGSGIRGPFLGSVSVENCCFHGIREIIAIIGNGGTLKVIDSKFTAVSSGVLSNESMDLLDIRNCEFDLCGHNGKRRCRVGSGIQIGPNFEGKLTCIGNKFKRVVTPPILNGLGVGTPEMRKFALENVSNRIIDARIENNTLSCDSDHQFDPNQVYSIE